ncbi:radical SAM protein with 4Fe4S-binding SPASM domain [Paenibacillus phyllosphaerae]|uniref:Radical SAM protein with 4Fe4S-binding SPASM domain n=1 Tax=Paenibacillus phyllosphaerae TaxID=274593 RepID=A0A7W5FKG2_9BACL|nr:radical SAM/SPASM domain-containing protein [Paenibacillus phyllosphaerae]MBB3108130.1 radical SAM protein with 4Fe4S-binding SPASM domain [Paenibacillus phyllosphaerae]
MDALNPVSQATGLASLLRMPKWIFLQLIESCNLRCRMCYEWGETGTYKEKPELKQLDLDVVRRIIEDCKDSKPHYDLFGGEPLLYPHIESVLTMLRENGSTVAFPTNGTLLKRHAAMLVRTQPYQIWVSLDGPEEINDAQRGKGVYRKALEGIDEVLRLREEAGSEYPKIGITCTVTPLNYHRIESFFFDMISARKLDAMSFELQSYLTEEDHANYVHVLQEHFDTDAAPFSRGFVRGLADFEQMDLAELNRQLEAIRAYSREHQFFLNLNPKDFNLEKLDDYFHARWDRITAHKKRCPQPWTTTEINAKGDVTTCHAHYDLTLGNVNEESIQSIWNGPKYKQFRNYLKKNLFPICTACCLYYQDNTLVEKG